MTNWGFDESDNGSNGLGDDELNGPKALRDYVKKLQAQNEDLNTKLTSFLEDQAKSKLTSVFENLGIPDAAKVYQGPADPEKAKEWAESMKAVFGSNTQGGTPPVTDEVAAEPTLPASMQAQFQRMTEAGQNGTATGNMEAAQTSIGNATSSADLIAAFDRLNRM